MEMSRLFAAFLSLLGNHNARGGVGMDLMEKCDVNRNIGTCSILFSLSYFEVKCILTIE